MNQWRIFAVLTVMQMASIQAEIIDADWLYMSPSGTWLERSQSLSNTETPLTLPVDNLTPDLFWWKNEAAGTSVSWQSSPVKGWPKEGDVVTSDQLAGEWTVTQAQANYVALSQDLKRRIWPSAQMHLLEWSVGSENENFELLVEQPSNKKSEFQYAWLDAKLNAKVSYRLPLSDDPVLYQELIISNDSSYDVIANGYSFSMASSQPIAAREMVSLSRLGSTPEASQSQGVPTLISSNLVILAAQTNVWLPVSDTPLSSIERQYSLTWDSRMQGVQQANTALRIKSSSPLPEIPGAITVGVFDQQVPTMSSQYQPSSENEALLNFGQSALVTLDAKVIAENQWQLVILNRTEETADIDLTLSHWNGNTLDKIPMSLKIKANRSNTLNIELSESGKLITR